MNTSLVFTLQHANKMLPLIKGITDDIMSLWNTIIVLRNKLNQLEEDTSGRTTTADRQLVKNELNQTIDDINRYIKEIENLGCFVEEFKRGIVNFPSMFKGRKVFLCWQSGDDRVEYWHEIDESINDRRLVTDGVYEDKEVPHHRTEPRLSREDIGSLFDERM